MSSRLSIVPHAVERYRERWAPHLSPEQARRELIEISHEARPTKRRTLGGQELWTTSKILFVVKRDSGVPICVTILPAGSFESPDMSPDMSEFLEYQQDTEAENLRIAALLAAEGPSFEEAVVDNEPLASPHLEALRRKGRLCDLCRRAEASRYYAPDRQKWCGACYKAKQLAAKGALGKVPKLEKRP